VEYSLTELGKELIDPIATIRDWAVAHMERVITALDVRRVQRCFELNDSPNPVVPAANLLLMDRAYWLDSHVCKASMTAIS
jgi:hypothetical protein